MAEIEDDKAIHVIPFILENLKTFTSSLPQQSKDQPFFIGLNGVQGAGKSVLVSILFNLITCEPYNLPTVVFSLDDLYLSHEDQRILAKSHPDNPLLQHRGQPGTHDIPLALDIFGSLKKGEPVSIPQYDKSAFQGQGDRVPSSQWETVNQENSSKIKVVLFEGWCVGFRPLTDDVLRSKHVEAITAAKSNGSKYSGRLGHNTFESIKTINEALKQYDVLTDQLDAFIHIDALDPLYVYSWRLQQEQKLRDIKGSGMTDVQVKHFVDGYYPAYELYTDTLRYGVFKPRDSAESNSAWRGKQLRMVVDEKRRVKDVIRI